MLKYPITFQGLSSQMKPPDKFSTQNHYLVNRIIFPEALVMKNSLSETLVISPVTVFPKIESVIFVPFIEYVPLLSSNPETITSLVKSSLNVALIKKPL